MLLSVSHPLRPRRRSLNTARVADAFGLDVGAADRRTIADDFDVPAGPGTLTLFTGPSGSGKSSLLRAAVAALESAGVPVVRADRPDLPDAPLADALAGLLPGGFDAARALFSRCGLAEPRLLLRTPAELSDGQRFRFRLALAVARASADPAAPGVVACDEFAALLDRTLAAAVAHNVRRLCDASGVGFLLATTHEDLAADLRPHAHARCFLNRPPTLSGPAAGENGDDGEDEDDDDDDGPFGGRRVLGRLFADDDLAGRVSFARDLVLTTATRGDWPRFAGWHYRAHTIGVVRAGALLWHASQAGDRGKTTGRHAEPVGAALFCSAPLSLRGRNRYFGTGPGGRRRT